VCQVVQGLGSEVDLDGPIAVCLNLRAVAAVDGDYRHARTADASSSWIVRAGPHGAPVLGHR